jgi:hypothetical protein
VPLITDIAELKRFCRGRVSRVGEQSDLPLDLVKARRIRGVFGTATSF